MKQPDLVFLSVVIVGLLTLIGCVLVARKEKGSLWVRVTAPTLLCVSLLVWIASELNVAVGDYASFFWRCRAVGLAACVGALVSSFAYTLVGARVVGVLAAVFLASVWFIRNTN